MRRRQRCPGAGRILASPRRNSSYRDYSDDDVALLRFIANARDLSFSIEEIGELLDLWRDNHRASSEVKAMALAKADGLDRKAAALSAMRPRLLHLAENCHGNDRPECPLIDQISGRHSLLHP